MCAWKQIIRVAVVGLAQVFSLETPTPWKTKSQRLPSALRPNAKNSASSTAQLPNIEIGGRGGHSSSDSVRWLKAMGSLRVQEYNDGWKQGLLGLGILKEKNISQHGGYRVRNH